MAINLGSVASFSSVNEVANAFKAGTISWSFAYGAMEDIFEEGVIPEGQWDAYIVSLIGQNPSVTAPKEPDPGPDPVPVKSETTSRIKTIVDGFKAGTMFWVQAYGAIINALRSDPAVPGEQYGSIAVSYIGKDPKEQPPPAAEQPPTWLGEVAEEPEEPEEYDPGPSPLTQYLRQIGLGTPGARTQGESYYESLFRPISSLFSLEGRFGPAVDRDPGQIEQYLTANSMRFRNNPRSIYADAGNILRRLISLGPEERELSGTKFSGYYPEYGGGTRKGDVDPDIRQRLFELALRPLFGVAGANKFAARLPEEEKIWGQERANDPTTDAFLDWLMNKYGFGKNFIAATQAATTTKWPAQSTSTDPGESGSITAELLKQMQRTFVP
jgi:hypothetical protein